MNALLVVFGILSVAVINLIGFILVIEDVEAVKAQPDRPTLDTIIQSSAVGRCVAGGGLFVSRKVESNAR